MTPEQLKRWREDMGFPQRAAAEALGITLATYQRLERGQEWDGSKPVFIDRRTALACAAIRAGLTPEGSTA
ncbi:MAG: helix-turn-helix domain-containing protein [Proteobacteria bacterium]|nr:helix-turn-helix domain-containing protein [Pseudomonadota bacterium]